VYPGNALIFLRLYRFIRVSDHLKGDQNLYQVYLRERPRPALRGGVRGQEVA
jgi:hypothetical protein